MKRNLKTGLLILSVSLLTITASAQRGKRVALNTRGANTAMPAKLPPNALVGVWELASEGPAGSPQSNMSTGMFKIFGGDNTFTHLQVRDGRSFKSHTGVYKLNSKQKYTETITWAKDGMIYVAPGDVFPIEYSLSDDQKTLTLTSSAKGKEGYPDIHYTEVWRRL